MAELCVWRNEHRPLRVCALYLSAQSDRPHVATVCCVPVQNFRGFDIANHFNEWAGGTDTGEPDYSAFPTPAQQEAFCAAYLTETQGSADGTSELVAEASKFVLANHWYWGLWAINQARDEGCEDFAYLTYAQRRIGQYYKMMQ